MKLTKQELKQIIKEELGGVLSEMGPDRPLIPTDNEELPQGAELDQALNPSMPSDIEALESQIANLLDSFQGLDAHGNYAEGGMMAAAQQHLHSLMQLVNQLKAGGV